MLNLIPSLKGKKILVVGDIMVDKYIYGDVTRISPEAPVPILHAIREEFLPGGASNVAANISSIGSHAIICGIIGDDDSGKRLVKELSKRGIGTEGIITAEDRPTIQKIRYMGGKQQLIRVDREETHTLSVKTQESLLAKLKTLSFVDGIIVSDYAKGLISFAVMDTLREIAHSKKIPIVVDGKPKNREWFNSVTLITPNFREATEMSGIIMRTDSDLDLMGKKLAEMLDCNVLITLGDKGMALFEKGKKMELIPTKAREVYDVTGAGDTVAAVLTSCLAAKNSMSDSAKLANYAAGVVVGKVGVSVVTPEELAKAISLG